MLPSLPPLLPPSAALCCPGSLTAGPTAGLSASESFGGGSSSSSSSLVLRGRTGRTVAAPPVTAVDVLDAGDTVVLLEELSAEDIAVFRFDGRESSGSPSWMARALASGRFVSIETPSGGQSVVVMDASLASDLRLQIAADSVEGAAWVILQARCRGATTEDLQVAEADCRASQRSAHMTALCALLSTLEKHGLRAHMLSFLGTAHLLVESEQLGQIATALVAAGHAFRPALRAFPIPAMRAAPFMADVSSSQQVGLWRLLTREAPLGVIIERHVDALPTPEARPTEDSAEVVGSLEGGPLRMICPSGLFVELCIAGVDSPERHASCCGRSETLMFGKRSAQVLQRSVDFQPPRYMRMQSEVVLHRSGVQLNETSDPPGDFLTRWARITDGGERVASLELIPQLASGGEVHEGVWIFCGLHWARVVGPPRGQGWIGGTCCKSLSQLRRHHDSEAVLEELRRYEATLGILVAPGVLQITHQAWHPERAGQVLHDGRKGIGKVVVIEDEQLVKFGTEESWRIVDWSFNPFAPTEETSCQARSQNRLEAALAEELRRREVLRLAKEQLQIQQPAVSQVVEEAKRRRKESHDDLQRSQRELPDPNTSKSNHAVASSSKVVGNHGVEQIQCEGASTSSDEWQRHELCIAKVSSVPNEQQRVEWGLDVRKPQEGDVASADEAPKLQTQELRSAETEVEGKRKRSFVDEKDECIERQVCDLIEEGPRSHLHKDAEKRWMQARDIDENQRGMVDSEQARESIDSHSELKLQLAEKHDQQQSAQHQPGGSCRSRNVVEDVCRPDEILLECQGDAVQTAGHDSVQTLGTTQNHRVHDASNIVDDEGSAHQVVERTEIVREQHVDVSEVGVRETQHEESSVDECSMVDVNRSFATRPLLHDESDRQQNPSPEAARGEQKCQVEQRIHLGVINASVTLASSPEAPAISAMPSFRIGDVGVADVQQDVQGEAAEVERLRSLAIEAQRKRAEAKDRANRELEAADKLAKEFESLIRKRKVPEQGAAAASRSSQISAGSLKGYEKVCEEKPHASTNTNVEAPARVEMVEQMHRRDCSESMSIDIVQDVAHKNIADRKTKQEREVLRCDKVEDESMRTKHAQEHANRTPQVVAEAFLKRRHTDEMRRQELVLEEPGIRKTCEQVIHQQLQQQHESSKCSTSMLQGFAESTALNEPNVAVDDDTNGSREGSRALGPFGTEERNNGGNVIIIGADVSGSKMLCAPRDTNLFLDENHISLAAEAVFLSLPDCVRARVVEGGPCASSDPSTELLQRIARYRIALVEGQVGGSITCATRRGADALRDFVYTSDLNSEVEALLQSLDSPTIQRVIGEGMLQGNTASAALAGRLRRLRCSSGGASRVKKSVAA